jgi:hypothetical protein
MSQKAKDRKKVSTISYNKLGHTTRGLLLDNKAEKKILV